MTWIRTTTCNSPSTTPLTMLTSTIAWCTPCVERAHSARCSTHDDDTAHFMAQVLSAFTLPSMSSMRTLFDSLLPFYFYLFLLVLLRLLPPLRAVLWARQPDRHGKPLLTPPTRRVRTPTTSPSPFTFWCSYTFVPQHGLGMSRAREATLGGLRRHSSAGANTLQELVRWFSYVPRGQHDRRQSLRARPRIAFVFLVCQQPCCRSRRAFVATFLGSQD